MISIKVFQGIQGKMESGNNAVTTVSINNNIIQTFEVRGRVEGYGTQGVGNTTTGITIIIGDTEIEISVEEEKEPDECVAVDEPSTYKKLFGKHGSIDYNLQELITYVDTEPIATNCFYVFNAVDGMFYIGRFEGFLLMEAISGPFANKRKADDECLLENGDEA